MADLMAGETVRQMDDQMEGWKDDAMEWTMVDLTGAWMDLCSVCLRDLSTVDGMVSMKAVHEAGWKDGLKVRSTDNKKGDLSACLQWWGCLSSDNRMAARMAVTMARLTAEVLADQLAHTMASMWAGQMADSMDDMTAF